jgi:hypothetical protein
VLPEAGVGGHGRLHPGVGWMQAGGRR